VDKGCLLVEAIGESKAKQRAEAALVHTDTFAKAVRSLKRHYEDDQLLFSHHFEELSQSGHIKNSVEDLDRLEDRLQSAFRGMTTSNGYSADQKAVAITERATFTWTHSSVETVYSRRHHAGNFGPLVPCLTDNEFEHRITDCPHSSPKDRLIATDLYGRLEQARQRRLCFNCLIKDHSASQCPSKKRCKRCQAKHYTLLHKDTAPTAEGENTDLPPETPAYQKTSCCQDCLPAQNSVGFGMCRWLLQPLQSTAGYRSHALSCDQDTPQLYQS